MSTHHIQAPRKAFAEHLATCDRCMDHLTAYDCGLCDVGQVAWDEYAASITANPLCEHIEATDKEATDER